MSRNRMMNLADMTIVGTADYATASETHLVLRPNLSKYSDYKSGGITIENEYVKGHIGSGKVVVGNSRDGNAIGFLLSVEGTDKILFMYMQNRYYEFGALIADSFDSAMEHVYTYISPMQIDRYIIGDISMNIDFDTSTRAGAESLTEQLEAELNRICREYGCVRGDGWHSAHHIS